MEPCARCQQPIPPPEPGSIAAGYALYQLDEDSPEQKVCYACARDLDLAQAAEHGVLFAYIQDEETPRPKLATWPGLILASPVILTSRQYDNFGGYRRSIRFILAGENWYGTYYESAGDYARCRRSKRQDIPAAVWLRWD